MGIRIGVVDDHALFRAGLISLLNDVPEIEVVGEAGDGFQALEIIEKFNPDVLLLDVNMPGMGGVETVKAIRKLPKNQQCKILMLTISKNEEDLLGAITAGADGYLLKDAEPIELQRAINIVLEGMSILSPQITHKVFKVLASDSGYVSDFGLSNREKEVLFCLSEGKTTIQIASDLYISENTVKTHVRHILEKLDAVNRTEAVNKANQLGLLNKLG